MAKGKVDQKKTQKKTQKKSEDDFGTFNNDVDMKSEDESTSEFSFDVYSQDGSVDSSTDLSSSNTGSQDESSSGGKKSKKVETIRLDPEIQKALEKKIEENKTPILEIVHQDKKSAVICLANIPSSFVEPVMKSFFSQFGIVTRLIVPKKRSGYPEGHAYIEFMDPVVAQIVSDTMNGYIMFRKVLKCTIVPVEQTYKCFLIKRDEEVDDENKVDHNMVKEHIKIKSKILNPITDLQTLSIPEKKAYFSLIQEEKNRIARCKKLNIDYRYTPLAGRITKKTVSTKTTPVKTPTKVATTTKSTATSPAAQKKNVSAKTTPKSLKKKKL